MIPARDAADEVIVWATDTSSVPASALDVLDGAERRRAAALRHGRDRAMFVGAHWLLRHALSDVCATVAPAAWRFEREPEGRPVLAAPFREANLRFSISHGAGAAVVAVARGRDVGIDVDADDDAQSAAAIARCAMTAAERAAWSALDAPLSTRFALECWALKEAYSKARGRGLLLDFDRIDFCDDGDGDRSLRTVPDADRTDRWRFALLPMRHGRVGALAVAAGVGEPLHCTIRTIGAASGGILRAKHGVLAAG